MITRLTLELEMTEIIDKCENVKQVNMIVQAISNSLRKIAKTKKQELNELLPKELEDFFYIPPNEYDSNFKSIFESKHDYDIAEEPM